MPNPWDFISNTETLSKEYADALERVRKHDIGLGRTPVEDKYEEPTAQFPQFQGFQPAMPPEPSYLGGPYTQATGFQPFAQEAPTPNLQEINQGLNQFAKYIPTPDISKLIWNPEGAQQSQERTWGQTEGINKFFLPYVAPYLNSPVGRLLSPPMGVPGGGSFLEAALAQPIVGPFASGGAGKIAFAKAGLRTGLKETGKLAGQVGRGLERIGPYREKLGFANVPEGAGAIGKAGEGKVNELNQFLMKVSKQTPEQRNIEMQDLISAKDDIETTLGRIDMQTQGYKEALKENPLATDVFQKGSIIRKGAKKGQPTKQVTLDTIIEKYGNWPDSLTKEEAWAFKREKPGTPMQFPARMMSKENPKRVSTTYLVDEIADAYGMTENEFMTSLNNIGKVKQAMKAQIRDTTAFEEELVEINDRIRALKGFERQEGMAPSTSVQAGMGIGEKPQPVKMFEEVTGKYEPLPADIFSEEQLLARQKAKPLPGQVGMEVPKVGDWFNNLDRRNVDAIAKEAGISRLSTSRIDKAAYWDTITEGERTKLRNFYSKKYPEVPPAKVEMPKGVPATPAEGQPPLPPGYYPPIKVPGGIPEPGPLASRPEMRWTTGGEPETIYPKVPPEYATEYQNYPTFQGRPAPISTEEGGKLALRPEMGWTTPGEHVGKGPLQRKPGWKWEGITEEKVKGESPLTQKFPETPTPNQTPSGRVPGGIKNAKEVPPADNYARLQDALTPSKVPFWQRTRDYVDDIMRHFYDPAWELNELQKYTKIPAHDLYQIVAGAGGHAEEIIRQLYVPVIKPVQKVLRQVEEYMVLMRNQDILVRNPQVILPGNVAGWKGTLQALDRLKSKLGTEQFNVVKKAADELWKINDEAILQQLRYEGLISKNEYLAIKSANPHYIPFQREDFITALEGAFKRPIASVSGTGIKKLSLEGSVRKLDQPFDRFMATVPRTMNLIYKNRAAKGIGKALQELESLTGKHIIDYVTPKKELINIQRVTGQNIPVVSKAERSVLRDTISWFENGEKVTIEVPQIYARIAKSMETESGNILRTVFRVMKSGIQAGAVTYNPLFSIVNVIRDATTAFYRGKLVPLSPEYIRGWTSVIKKDALYSDVAKSGGFMSTLTESMKVPSAKGIVKRALMQGGITVQEPIDLLWLIPRLIEKTNVTSERATRIAAFAKARAKGLSQLEAAIVARDITVDFSKMGTTMSVVNDIIPFSNARLQCTANILRTIKKDPKWGLLIASSPFVGATILCRVNNMRYESSNKIPLWEYTNNWILQLGEFKDNKTGEVNPIYTKIPKGDIGSFLTFIPEALFNWNQYDDDRSIVEHILGSGLQSVQAGLPVSDVSVTGILPPPIATGVSMQTGIEGYTGAPIIPRREQNLPPSQQFGPESSTTAVMLGKKFNISPRMIDYAIRGNLATGGQQLTWLADLGLSAIGYNKPDPFGGDLMTEQTGAEKTTRIPGVSRFLGTKGTAQDTIGWDKLDKVSLDTQRQFNEIPDMNNLGIKLGIVGDSLHNIELTPQQRADYQSLMADKVIPGIRDYVPSPGVKKQPELLKIVILENQS